MSPQPSTTLTAPGSQEPLRIAVIIGSVRAERIGHTVAAWFADLVARRPDLSLDVIDVADLPLPLAGPSRAPAPEAAAVLAESRPRLARADAFVVVTPEYNHSFPAALKNAIDWHREEWQAKPVGFVCYGGFSAGLRAVEQLRQVFAELHAVTVRDTVGFHGGAAAFDQGVPRDREPAEAAAKVLLDQLVWWGRALRQARATHPYGA
ncbi:NAD(P)H-dependent oxidoreductase [Streptomyces europaeiscabiei]|uniref:NADPH-dependent FMN reductase n=1 Tax=Streptomyces europaeiscabiei TaxID=146819 RepID=UPI0029A2CC40|nr:NAD(P)H-dependent oxidoreductase [Streptomyces europaeiscabiei]MDX3691346.1 NAD(P)H-dependent oxidoreductase [Streptomyces europaeiscabiei]